MVLWHQISVLVPWESLFFLFFFFQSLNHVYGLTQPLFLGALRVSVVLMVSPLE